MRDPRERQANAGVGTRKDGLRWLRNPAARYPGAEFARRAALASAIGSAVVSMGPTGAVGAEIAPAPRSRLRAREPGSDCSFGASLRPTLPANMARLSPESQAEADAGFMPFWRSTAAASPTNRKPISVGFAPLRNRPLDRLRAYAVQNGDGTALYLKPLFEREKKPKPPAGSQPGAAKPARLRPPRLHPTPRKTLRETSGCPARNSFTCRVTELAKRIETKQVSPVELHAALPEAQRKVWAPTERLRAAHSRDRSCAGAGGGKRDSARALSRAAARNPLRCQGSAGREGRAYYLGREALCESGLRLRRYRYRTFESCGGGATRQSVDDRAGRRNELPLRVRVAAGSGEKSLGHVLLDLRVVFRLGSDRRGGAGGVCNRYRDLGIDHLPFGVLRNQRAAAHVRAREPVWGYGAGAFDGQDRADGAIGGRLRADFCGAGGTRSQGSRDFARGQSRVHLFALDGIEDAVANGRLAHQCMENHGPQRRENCRRYRERLCGRLFRLSITWRCLKGLGTTPGTSSWGSKGRLLSAA